VLDHNRTDSMIEGTVCPISFVKDVLVCVGFLIVYFQLSAFNG
jgi:hypothetical protein